MTTTRLRGPRTLLALAAVTALLLTGCSNDSDGGITGSGDDGGKQPGIEQVDDPTSDTPSTPDTSDGSDTSDGAESPAPSDDETSDAPVDTSDDDDLSEFPLQAGWPAEAAMEFEGSGLALPVAELQNSFAVQTCSEEAPEATTTGSLRGEFSDVEAYLSRELLVFADADAAVAYLSELDDFYASDACTSQRTGAGDGESTKVLRRFDTEAGGQSFAVVDSQTYEGEAQPGISALSAVRVGRSVLVDTTSGEGLVDSDADARDLADSMVVRARDAIAAQCRFTAAGC